MEVAVSHTDPRARGRLADAFLPISGARAFEEVVEQTLYAIRSGRIPLGAKLPTVDELAVLMEVSKPVVGQALKTLADAGIVSVSRGAKGGVTVLSNEPPHERIVNIGPLRNFSLTEILDLRNPVETEIAILASRFQREEELQKLADSVKMLENHRNTDFRTSVYHDHSFHYILGQVSRSRALAYVQHAILERIYYEMAEHQNLRDSSTFESNVKWHWKTIDAIASRDDENIRKIMAGHLKPFYSAVLAMSRS